MVNVDQSEYLGNSFVAGIRVFIEQRGTKITDQIPFISVSPGFLRVTNIQWKELHLERDEPWSTCQSQAPEYTQALCRSNCIQAATMNKCNCQLLSDTDTQSNLTLCPGLGFECSEITEEDISDCGCSKPACSYTDHPIASSSTAIFSGPFKRNFRRNWNVSDAYLNTNIVVMVINYDGMVKDITTESKVQTLGMLLGGIGGQMGLFAGISVISVAEIFDLLFLQLLPLYWG